MNKHKKGARYNQKQNDAPQADKRKSPVDSGDEEDGRKRRRRNQQKEEASRQEVRYNRRKFMAFFETCTCQGCGEVRKPSLFIIQRK